MKTLFVFLLIWICADLVSPLPSVPVVRSITGTTENAEARKDFDRGLLLLHNFEYLDAAEMFRRAQQKDPGFAMAYWGEAMTYNHPIWLSQDTEKARKVIAAYKQVSQSSGRQLPRLDADLLRSLDILYGEGNKRERDKAYADFISNVYEKNRGNHDVAAFYALSLLGEAAGWNEEKCNKAAAIAGAILKEDPKHPGALHYFIHAEDHPEFAKLAVAQANDYARVASYSGHALHMPSHIYLALGLWNDVVKSNEISWQAGVDRKEAKKLTNDALNYHAHWWLEYGYLQQGRFSRAEEILRAQLAFTRERPSPSARNHFVIMRGHYLVESNDWKNDLTAESVKIQDLRIEIRNLDRFVMGLKAFKDGDERTLRKMLTDIEADLDQTRNVRTMNDGIAQCGTAPNANAGINQATILMEELKGLHACMQKDPTLAETHFLNAIQLEEENGHFFGPPEIMKPTHEFYGEFLLTVNKYKDARTSFERALRKTPGRNQSLAGLSSALRHTGDTAQQQQVARRLSDNLQQAEGSGIQGFFSIP